MKPSTEVELPVNTSIATAVEALNRGDLDMAEVHCRQALAQAPGHLGALAVLGGVLHALSRFREAESLFAELTDRAPQVAAHWMNLGTTRRASGKFEDALVAYARAAELGERSVDFLFNLGLTHLERQDYEAARSVLAQAIALAPADAEIRIDYARACEALGLDEEATSTLLGLQNQETLSGALRARIASQLVSLGEAELASRIAASLAADPSLEPAPALRLAQLYERLNRVDEARALVDRLKSDPRTLSHGVVLAGTEARLLHREGRNEQAIALLRKELGWRQDPQLRQADLFSLAKSLAALGQHAAGFVALEEAHRCQLSALRVSTQPASLLTLRPLLLARQSADADDVRRWTDSEAPAAAQSPVFVIGMPRSGKILVELMLDAHEQLVTSEGRPVLPRITAAWAALGKPYPQSLAMLSADQVRAARQSYWEAARRRFRLAEGQRLVDTDPMNLLQLPAIRRLFPHAHIIFVMRHPCDVLLSAYMQNFTAPDLATMSASLQTLAFSYDVAMRHWLHQRAILQPRVHEVTYEHLVAGFSEEARGLASALELPWRDAMGAPHERARSRGFIASASYAEASEPVYPHAVGQWRHYQERFAPVLPLMQPYGQHWNYEL